MKNSKLNSDLLIAVYQNILTARQSISNVIEKVHDSKLKKELDSQFNSYTPLKERCEKLAMQNKIDIVDNNFFEKAKMWMSVNMSILLDKSNRKIASIMIFGTTMGVIDLICVLSDCKKGSKEFLALAHDLKELEEQNIERVKPYLLKENNKPQKPPREKAKAVVEGSQNNQEKGSSESNDNQSNKTDKGDNVDL